MTSTADRYARVLWAIDEHHRRTRKWYATAAELAAIIGPIPGAPNAAVSIARTLHGLTTAGLVHSTHQTAKETRQWRIENQPHHAPFGAERWLNEPARYSTSAIGDTVIDMIGLVGDLSSYARSAQ